MSDKDTIFMRRALELAANGLGYTSPNPIVGCVVVYKEKIIGEGWHQFYGGPHAEANAIQSVKDKGLLPDSTVYVTLEPCNHYGLTPPCVDLLIQSNVKKAVICNQDPNPQVSGTGIEKLKKNKVIVETGMLSECGEEVNKRFFTFHRFKRPFIILKWAETADGFLARENFDSKWISNQYSRQLAHKWRAEEDAILVGKNTALYDDPSLNVRDSLGRDPMRVVIDKNLDLSTDLHIFDGQLPTLCFNRLDSEKRKNVEFIRIDWGNMEARVLKELYKRNVLSLIIEGGTKTLSGFIEKGLWDEARIFKSKKIFKQGITAPTLASATLQSVEHILDDQLFIYTKANG